MGKLSNWLAPLTVNQVSEMDMGVRIPPYPHLTRCRADGNTRLIWDQESNDNRRFESYHLDNS